MVSILCFFPSPFWAFSLGGVEREYKALRGEILKEEKHLSSQLGCFQNTLLKSSPLIRVFCFCSFCICQLDRITSYIWCIACLGLSHPETYCLPLCSDSSDRVTWKSGKCGPREWTGLDWECVQNFSFSVLFLCSSLSASLVYFEVNGSVKWQKNYQK